MAEVGRNDSGMMKNEARPEAAPREFSTSTPKSSTSEQTQNESGNENRMGVIRRLRDTATGVGGNLNHAIQEHPTSGMFASIAVGFVLGAAVTFLLVNASSDTY